jgi:hypothetical protein
MIEFAVKAPSIQPVLDFTTFQFCTHVVSKSASGQQATKGGDRGGN